jgi:hypothetical protein
MADEFLWDDPGVDLSELGPGANAVHESIRNPAFTMPFIATLFWRCWLQSENAITLTLHILKASRAAMREKEIYVVRHGVDRTRYDLVILDSDYRLDEPVARQVKPSRVDIRDGWRKVSRRVNPDFVLPWGHFDITMAPEAVDELMRVHEVGVIIAPKPTLVMTGAPSPAWEIADTLEDETGTAGAIVINADGKVGVTGPRHTFARSTEVTVNGMPGTVAARDEITDSCFIEVPDLEPPRGRKGLAGPLTYVPPGEGTEVSFEGAGSGAKPTKLVGWSPTILTPEWTMGHNRVLTTPDTTGGDSGAALIDSWDHILGFSTYRSAEGAVSEYSAWVWAHHVFRTLGLKLADGR